MVNPLKTDDDFSATNTEFQHTSTKLKNFE